MFFMLFMLFSSLRAENLSPVNYLKARIEVRGILEKAQTESGRSAYSPENARQFPDSYNVYVKSALAIDLTYRAASVTLPIYRGIQGNGDVVFYILTETSDKMTAEALGIIYAPRLAAALGSPGTQKVTLRDGGTMIFEGSVDFSPVREIRPGTPDAFPPAAAVPGAVADDKWSSIVSLPSGVVLNAQIVSNSTGNHDRLLYINRKVYTATLSILDGFQGGKQYFYHLVTDASADVPAALEDGILAPKLAQIPEFGVSTGYDSALLAFSPVLNGISDTSTGQDQGFEALLVNGGIDPINVFPYGPGHPNYSPLWDAHVCQWTQAAIDAGKVRRIVSFQDLKGLIQSGLVENAFINPEGPGNPFIFGLRPTRAIINCPVIAHPEASAVRR